MTFNVEKGELFKMTETTNLSERLGLEEFNVISVDQTDSGDYVFNAVPINPDKICPSCGSTAVVNNGTYNRFLHDINIEGHKSGINIMGNRHMCRNCGITFVDNFGCAAVKAKVTERLKAAIGEEEGSLSKIAAKYNLSVTTVRRVLSERGSGTGISRDQKTKAAKARTKKPTVALAEPKIKERAPLMIGLDEVRADTGKYAIAADLEHGKILGLLTGAVNVLGELEDKERTEYVFAGLDGEYAAAVHRLFPNAKIVIDKAHAIEKVKSAYTDMRKNIIFEKAMGMGGGTTQKAADGKTPFSADYSRLNAAFAITEDFKEVYRTASSEEAEKAFREWRDKIPDGFAELQRAAKELEGRLEEILNYFSCGTHGEAANRLHTLSMLLSEQRRSIEELVSVTNGAGIESLTQKISENENGFNK